MKRKLLLAVALVLVAIAGAYANYFLSDLHFGDDEAVKNNPAIRSLKNIPRFFFDSSTASTSPEDYVYRPVVTLSFAIDYFLGKGAPFFYRFDAFVIYLGGLALIAWMFFAVFERSIPHPWNPYLALMATALFGLHPAVAELLNPLSQRGEWLAALGVVGGIAVYAGLPEKRRFGFYLLPPLLGILANPAGLIFGPLLLAYILLIEPAPSRQDETFTEEQTKSRDETQTAVTSLPAGAGPKRVRIRRRKHPFRSYLKAQFNRFMPAFVFTAIAGALQSIVAPIHQAFGESVITYWFTEPWVAMRYFRSFFAPFYMSPASDLTVFATYDTRALLGIAFVISVISVALLLVISPQWRPAVFGLWWFLIGILPGAILIQPYVESDSRMFLPFIGLALSVTWAARMLLPSGEPLRRLEAIAAAGILLALGWQTHLRNGVWSIEETLWRDTIEKHPRSLRGLQNYAWVQSAKGQYRKAYEVLWEARRIYPQSAEVESRMGTVSAMLNRPDEADYHFHMGLSLGADRAICHYLYAVWLEKQGQRKEALEAYSWASSLAPTDLRPRYGMMRLYSAGHQWANLRKAVDVAGEIAPEDPAIVPFAAIARNHPDSVKGAEQLVKDHPTAENYLTLSDTYCLAGEYTKCLEAAQKAIQIKPGYAEAYNNAGAAYISLGRLDEAIDSVKKALEYDPDNKIAQANWREWESQKLVVGNTIMRK
jgi:tetratricopeptide (TPR) repeat protein